MRLRTWMLLLVAGATPASAQVSLSLGSGNSAPGGAITLNLALANSTQTQPASLQWTLNYPAADVSAVTTAVGPAATNAAKNVTCYTTTGNSTCVVSGINTNPIQSGTIASVTLQVASAPPDLSIPVQLTGLGAASSNGSGIAASGAGGTITLPASLNLTGISCSSSSLVGPASTSCTVALSANATGSGLTVNLNSNNSVATLPSSLIIPAGTSSAGFTTSVAQVTSSQTATVSASALGTTKSFNLTVSPATPVQVSSLTCNPASLSSGGSGSCSVGLSRSSTSSVTVSLSSNTKLLTLPTSVSVAAGSTSASFSAKAGTVTTNQSGIITATGPANSQSFTIGLLGGSGNPTPISIWSNNAKPGTVTDPDSNAIELGLKFQSDVSGSVTGVRFYKGKSNTDKHVGHLWTASGTLLASVDFTNETSSGWQQATFSTPVKIQANTVYVVSYYSPKGYYSSDTNFFKAAVNTPPLHALQNTSSAPNGVYAYGSSSFPKNSWQGSNYWVDLLFIPAGS